MLTTMWFMFGINWKYQRWSPWLLLFDWNLRIFVWFLKGSKIRMNWDRVKEKIIISQEFCFLHFYHFFIDGRYKSMVRMSKMKFTHSVWHTLSPHSKTIDAILDLSSSAAAAVMDIDNGRTHTQIHYISIWCCHHFVGNGRSCDFYIY